LQEEDHELEEVRCKHGFVKYYVLQTWKYYANMDL